MDNLEPNRLKELLDKFKIPIGLSLVGLILIIGGIFASGLNSSKKEFPKKSIVEAQKIISVDVSGAVQKPGVYKLMDGSRVEEAIASAGGFNDQANKEYISKYLNMAQLVTDGSKVYVPFVGESGSVPQSGGVVVGTQSKININTASQSELEALPGIGPVSASRIISDRPYQKIEDLVEKKIVNKSTFEKIKGSVIVY